MCTVPLCALAYDVTVCGLGLVCAACGVVRSCVRCAVVRCGTPEVQPLRPRSMSDCIGDRRISKPTPGRRLFGAGCTAQAEFRPPPRTATQHGIADTTCPFPSSLGCERGHNRLPSVGREPTEALLPRELCESDQRPLAAEPVGVERPLHWSRHRLEHRVGECTLIRAIDARGQAPERFRRGEPNPLLLVAQGHAEVGRGLRCVLTHLRQGLRRCRTDPPWLGATIEQLADCLCCRAPTGGEADVGRPNEPAPAEEALWPRRLPIVLLPAVCACKEGTPPFCCFRSQIGQQRRQMACASQPYRSCQPFGLVGRIE
mmetsp:Transcript_38651/g.87797  ORF Transcript_38651/g.87797 Transcript_38651/m.87797 type:complete len:315 (-) Transcript_38651:898-1842(-)